MAPSQTKTRLISCSPDWTGQSERTERRLHGKGISVFLKCTLKQLRDRFLFPCGISVPVGAVSTIKPNYLAFYVLTVSFHHFKNFCCHNNIMQSVKHSSYFLQSRSVHCQGCEPFKQCECKIYPQCLTHSLTSVKAFLEQQRVSFEAWDLA